MLERICVAVDGSDCSRRAAAVAIELGSKAGARVDVVRVLSDAEEVEEVEGVEEAEEVEGEGNGGRWNGERVLADVWPSGGDGSADDSDLDSATADVEGHVREGSPAKSIVAFADDRDADLLVLGRRGLGGLGDRLLGSVVHAVLRNADRPVLTVPDDDGPVTLSDVLMPTDGSDVATRAVPFAATLAGQFGGTVHTCYVLDLAREGGLFSAGGMTADEIQRLETEHRENLDRLADELRDVEPAASVESAILRDVAHAGIAEYVADNDVDLVVMGSDDCASAVGQLAGSVTEKVLGAVDVPVFVVGPDAT